MQRIAALAFCWRFFSLIPLMVGSTSATGAPRPLEPRSDEHSNAEQEVQTGSRPAAARLGQDGTWACRNDRDGAAAGGGSGAAGTGSR